MNKKTYGEGTRTERHDREVVAATIDAKEKLRDQLGFGEDIRTEELSRVEFEWRKVDAASDALIEASKAVIAAKDAEHQAWVRYRDALHDWAAAKGEGDNA